MTIVTTHAVVSTDGFIADGNDDVGPLFDWYGNGDVEIMLSAGTQATRLSRASADYVRPIWADMRCIIMGRRLFDITDGWQGIPTAGEHVFVVTHRPAAEWQGRFPDAPFTFVDGVAAAVEQAKGFAGDGGVTICAGDVAGQAIEAGLVDEVAMDVVPVVFGQGRRYFGNLDGQVLLEDPYRVVQGDRVMHLRYRVRRAVPAG